MITAFLFGFWIGGMLCAAAVLSVSPPDPPGTPPSRYPELLVIAAWPITMTALVLHDRKRGGR